MGLVHYLIFVRKKCFSELKSWKSYTEALAEPLYKERIVNLIREWESLRWREYMANKA